VLRPPVTRGGASAADSAVNISLSVLTRAHYRNPIGTRVGTLPESQASAADYGSKFESVARFRTGEEEKPWAG